MLVVWVSCVLFGGWSSDGCVLYDCCAFGVRLLRVWCVCVVRAWCVGCALCVSWLSLFVCVGRLVCASCVCRSCVVFCRVFVVWSVMVYCSCALRSCGLFVVCGVVCVPRVLRTCERVGCCLRVCVWYVRAACVEVWYMCCRRVV